MPNSQKGSPRFAVEAGFAPISILVGIVILTVIVGGVYLITAKNTSQPQKPIITTQISISPIQPLTKISASPTPTAIDETTNWKVYSNEKYSYSIKYPSNWTIDESKANHIHFYPQHLTQDMQDKLTGWGPFSEPEVFVNVLSQSYEKPILTEFDLKTSTIVPQIVKADDIEGYYYQKSSVPISPILADFPLEQNQTLQLGMITVGQFNIDEIKKEFNFIIQDPTENIFKQMISSLKLIDKNQETNNCSDGFKNYDGEAFSVCYPKDATVKVDKFIGKNKKTTIQVEFDDSTDVIVVASNNEAGPEQNRCLFPEQAVIGNLSAVRYTQKRPTANNTCGGIYQFITFINNGGLTYLIIDTKRQVFTDNFTDMSKYKIIEQSFKLKNP